MQTLTLATSHTLIRQAFSEYEPWIRSRLSCPLADTIILRTEVPFSQLGLTLLSKSELSCPRSRELEIVHSELECISLPPGTQPILDLNERAGDSLRGRGQVYRKCHPWSLSWASCPVALGLRTLPAELIAVRVVYFGGLHEGEVTDDLLLFRREDAEQVVAWIARLTEPEAKPCVRTWGEARHPVEPCSWDQLTLAPEVRTLLQHDFEAFFEDKEWYEEMRIPHRRGYLLHGPPGNGKTSAVRAMLASRGLTAYQLRLFGKNMSDDDLERVFRQAAHNSPAVVLLEDLDRAFPRSGNSQSKVHLQTLLNCLDGVATEPGVIAVATANEPSLLDAAILRRPGRFDRVVQFANPSSKLREEYLIRMRPLLAGQNLDSAIEASTGFSFALMREMYIMAAQSARSASRAIGPEDLVASAELLRQGYQLAERKGAAAGFVAKS